MNSTRYPSENGRRVAREALEHVCSGSGAMRAADCYSPTFVDHLNGTEFHGLAGVERSVILYRSVLSDLRIAVREQLVDEDRVASRYVISGTCRGRRVTFDGITISRLENGLVVEDWSGHRHIRDVAPGRLLACAVDSRPAVADCAQLRLGRRRVEP
jgi:SnoaL-like polyketide cyclase